MCARMKVMNAKSLNPPDCLLKIANDDLFPEIGKFYT